VSVGGTDRFYCDAGQPRLRQVCPGSVQDRELYGPPAAQRKIVLTRAGRNIYGYARVNMTFQQRREGIL
jgi:hypothetical protein